MLLQECCSSRLCPYALALAGRAGAGEPRASLDSVWLRLQQQHTLESEAASLEQAAGGPGGEAAGGPAPADAPEPVSEADFWKKLQQGG